MYTTSSTTLIYIVFTRNFLINLNVSINLFIINKALYVNLKLKDDLCKSKNLLLLIFWEILIEYDYKILIAIGIVI